MQKVHSFELLLGSLFLALFTRPLFLFNFPSRYSSLSLFSLFLEGCPPLFFLYSLFSFVFRSPLLHSSLLILLPFTSDVSFLRFLFFRFLFDSYSSSIDPYLSFFNPAFGLYSIISPFVSKSNLSILY